MQKTFCFVIFCSSIYGINLWFRYPASSIYRFRVAYNNAYRILFNLPRRIHINETMINNGISTFYSLIRKHTANFIIRCKHSPNACIQQIFGSACFLDSDFSIFSKLLKITFWLNEHACFCFVLCLINLFVCFCFFALLWTFVESVTNK